MKTTEEIKNIWKKSMMECVTQHFTLVTTTAADEVSKPELNVNNIQACMAQVRDSMEQILESQGINNDDKIVIKEHAEEWTKESMPWIMDLIIDKLKIKETLIKKGN